MNSLTLPLSKSDLSQQIFDFLGPIDSKNLKISKDFIYNQIPPLERSPAKSRASEVFWGLKDCWWKQIMDGHYHEFGCMAFDQGLHVEGKIEPGFYNGILNACRFIDSRFCELPTSEFYKRIHAIACAHFDGKKTRTLITAKDTGQFRKRGAPSNIECKVSYLDTDPHLTQQRKELLADMSDIYCASKVYENADQKAWKQSFLDLGFIRESDFLIAVKHAKSVLQKFNTHIAKRVRQLNTEIQRRSAELNIAPIAVITQLETEYPWEIKIVYKNNDVEPVVNQLFQNYAVNSNKARTVDEKIRAIADLYQMLEWLHPFTDGQGRTDIILKEKLLCDSGLTPSILDSPYLSTFAPLNEWVAYLKQGMVQWKKEFASLNPDKER